MYVEINAYILTYIFSAIGLLFTGYCVFKISEVKIREIHENEFEDEEPEAENEKGERKKPREFTAEQMRKLNFTATKIAEGANVFLFKEYLIMLIFIVGFGIAIVFLGEYKLGYFYTTVAFIVGSQTSLFAGFVGMKVATATNSKTAYKAW